MDNLVPLVALESLAPMLHIVLAHLDLAKLLKVVVHLLVLVAHLLHKADTPKVVQLLVVHPAVIHNKVDTVDVVSKRFSPVPNKFKHQKFYSSFFHLYSIVVY